MNTFKDKLEILKTPLTQDQIELKITPTSKGSAKYNVMIYKTARVDMARLDDAFGFNWKREHFVLDGSIGCRVSIWNEELDQWVSREDCGDSQEGGFASEIKSRCSDSFKRACFCFGIGRELYETGFICITNGKQADSTIDPKYPARSVKIQSYNYDKAKKEINIVIVHRETGEQLYPVSYSNKAYTKPTQQNTQPIPSGQVTPDINAIIEDLKNRIENAKTKQDTYNIYKILTEHYDRIRMADPKLYRMYQEKKKAIINN
jgi:hypothetical protein